MSTAGKPRGGLRAIRKPATSRSSFCPRTRWPASIGEQLAGSEKQNPAPGDRGPTGFCAWAGAAKEDLKIHRERSIPIRRGRGRHEAEQFHVRFCFPDGATADAFQERFGGTRLTYSPSKPGRPSGPRVRYQRSYSPRIVGGNVMTPADLRRLHKYMLEVEGIDHISDEMRAVVESEWPELAHKLPPKAPQG